MEYKKGDIVRVYSLQSFHHGGFINGTEGIVVKDQGDSNGVVVAVERNFDGKHKIDSHYEVYAEQLQLVCNAGEERIHEFNKLIKAIKKEK